MTESHYEVLGVETDASRDDIRAAYRDRVAGLKPDIWKGDAETRRDRSAAVNKAWNVLSDPFQKERYDRELGARPDPPGPDEPDSAPVRRSARNEPAPAAASGVRTATTRSRLNALTVDVVALFLVYNIMTFGMVQLFAPDAVQVSVRSSVVRTVDLGGKSFAALRKDLADQEWRKYHAKHPNAARKDAKIATKKVKNPTQALLLVASFAALLLGLAYTVLPTLRSGQTLGKRIAKLRLASADGTDVVWSQALLHYGVPITIAVTPLPIVPGPLVAIGLVVWFIWDKRRQGVDDKIAKTLVVEV